MGNIRVSQFCFMNKMISFLTNNSQELGEFLNHWAPYKFLWKNNEQNKREMLNASLNEFESWLRRHCELESHLTTEPDQHVFGSSLVISAGENYKLHLSFANWFRQNKLPVCHL
jgi:hypothetical protein